MTPPEGIKPPFTTKTYSDEHHLAYGEKFFTEDLKYKPHSPYSAGKASSDYFVRTFHDTYGLPTIVTNCSNNYGLYQFPEKLTLLYINNIRHRPRRLRHALRHRQQQTVARARQGTSLQFEEEIRRSSAGTSTTRSG